MVVRGKRGYYEITISQLSDDSFKVDVIDNLPTGQRPIGTKILDTVTNSAAQAKVAAGPSVANTGAPLAQSGEGTEARMPAREKRYFRARTTAYWKFPRRPRPSGPGRKQSIIPRGIANIRHSACGFLRIASGGPGRRVIYSREPTGSIRGAINAVCRTEIPLPSHQRPDKCRSSIGGVSTRLRPAPRQSQAH